MFLNFLLGLYYLEKEENVIHEMKSYLSHVRMIKLVPNDNFLCKSSSQRSYLGL